MDVQTLVTMARTCCAPSKLLAFEEKRAILEAAGGIRRLDAGRFFVCDVWIVSHIQNHPTLHR